MTNLMNDINVLDKYAEGIHPVANYSFDDLITELRADIELGRINSRVEGDHELFDYNSYGIFDHGWSKVAMLARGLVVNHKLGKVVAMPFPKFFNYGEATFDLPDGEFSVTKKMDGSLGICYWFEDGENSHWRVNTRGSFESDQAKWATKWLNADPLRTMSFNKGDTYLFEIIYPENKIVIAYDYTGLVLLGAYHEDGKEYQRLDLELYAVWHYFEVVEEENFESIEVMLEKAKALPSNEEGWVLKFPSGYRVKIKGDEYCRVHRLISNCTPLAVYNSYIAMDDFEDLKRDLPEEFRLDIDNMLSIFSAKLDAKLEKVAEWLEKTYDMDNRDVGLAVNKGEIPKDVAKWIFANRKVDLFAEINKTGDYRKKFLEEFRPKANFLEGYTPSTAMNRFTGEES